jgi:hypothetical protein
MRNLGLKGSSGKYELPSDTHFALIGFPRSYYSTSAVVTFTVDLKVVNREVWEVAKKEEPWLPARPSASVLHPPHEWSERLGHLMPAAADLWWTMGTEPPAELTNEIISAVRDYGLPAMREAMTDRA